MNANPAPRQSFTIGLAALAAQCAELDARREQAAQERRAARERASRYQDPGLSIDTTLLPYEIPAHVDALLATPTRRAGEAQDQQTTFGALKRVVHSLLMWGGHDVQWFLEWMPGYAPGGGENVLWHELTTRRGRRQNPVAKVEKAFKYAREHIDAGLIPEADQLSYIHALNTRWAQALQTGRICLAPAEAGVLRYVMTRMAEQDTLKVTCPARTVGHAAGVSAMGAWGALKRLAADEILICHELGQAYGNDKPEKALAAVYSLSPQVPGGRCAPRTSRKVRSKHPEAKRKRSDECPGSCGIAPSVNAENPQVNPQKRGCAEHIEVYTTTPQLPSVTALIRGPGLSGSCCVNHFTAHPEIPGVYLVSEHDLSHTPVPADWTPAKVDELEDFFARQWGASAVLIPAARWPRLSCFPPVLAFESFTAAQHWVREHYVSRPGPETGPATRFPFLTEQKPKYAASEAHAQLQIWLGRHREGDRGGRRRVSRPSAASQGGQPYSNNRRPPGLLGCHTQPTPGQGLSAPGGRAGDTPDHLAGLTVLARVVDRTEKFLAELESLMGNSAPAPQPQEDPEEDYDPLSGYTPAQKAAIWRVQNGVHLREWRNASPMGAHGPRRGPDDLGPVTGWWGRSDHLDFNRYDTPPGHSRGPEDHNTFSALALTPEQAAAVLREFLPPEAPLRLPEGSPNKPDR
jgi:hypothetical protein